MQRRQEHIGLLVAEDVAADGFAEGRRVAIHVQNVILQLKSQSDMDAEVVQRLLLRLGGIGNIRAYLQGGREQYRGLEPNHHHIIVYRHIVSALEIHIVLLPFAYLRRHFVEQPKHLWQLIFPHLT